MAVNWRPDPAKGVFETLLVHDGRPVEAAAHLGRLGASLEALYPGPEAPSLAELIEAAAEGAPAASLRIDVAPAADGKLVARAALRPCVDFFSDSEKKSTGSALRALRLRGGLGAHKWADRSLLEESEAGMPDDALPLLLDAEDAILEASRANLFAVRDGVLSTPPLDGRVLPGITRARVLELAAAAGLRAVEEPLCRADLLAAEEVFLTGSVRGIEPAGSLDGEPLAGAGPIAARLAAELRRAWTGEKAPAAFG